MSTEVYITVYKTTRALVLREVRYKEADKILTVLTESDGKLTVRARGALRKSCRYAASSQLLTFSEMTLFGNRGRWSINEASTLEEFSELRGDIGKLALGAYFAELIETVSDEDSPNPEVLQLGLNSLYALGKGLCGPGLIKAVFELRLMCLAGYEPQLDACGVCGKTEIREPQLSLNGGILHCGECRAEERGISLPLCRDSLGAARHIVSAEPKKIFSFTLPAEAEARLSDTAEAYVKAQLERGFSALDYYKRFL